MTKQRFAEPTDVSGDECIIGPGPYRIQASPSAVAVALYNRLDDTVGLFCLKKGLADARFQGVIDDYLALYRSMARKDGKLVASDLEAQLIGEKDEAEKVMLYLSAKGVEASYSPDGVYVTRRIR